VVEKKSILIACYGGGHAQSLIPVAKKLREHQFIDLTIIGFTTARSMFERAGLDVLGYDALLDDSDYKWVEKARAMVPTLGHSDVRYEETLAYYAIGLKNLVLEYGEEQGLLLYKQKKRKIFFPKKTFIDFLKKNRQDFVITSTSPRSELALLHASSCLNIPNLAVSDLFLQHESSYICSRKYASNVTVISPYVSDFLKSRGFPVENTIHVTGNPAFDCLINYDLKRNAKEIRSFIGCPQNEKIITWICTPSNTSLTGKVFVETKKVIDYLEWFCKKHTGYRYLIRQHPNSIIELNHTDSSLSLPNVSIEECLHLSDILMMETSTVGLQAALLNKPVVTINAGNYPPYAALKLAVDVDDLKSAERALLKAERPYLGCLNYPNLGGATNKVVEIVMENIQKKSYSNGLV
jgi:hypothetical protein